MEQVPASDESSKAPDEDEAEKIAKKKRFVIQEIITTELTYIDRLKLAIDFVIVPLRVTKILDQTDIAEQFALIEKIYELHSRNSLSGSTSHNLKFVELFNDMANNFNFYSDYLVNFEPAMQKRGHLLTSNRKFAEYIARIEKDPSVNQTLESLLILPVQRIPRYRLLLEQLLKYTPESHGDFTVVQNALDKICDLASYNNEAIRIRENKNKIMSVMMQIDPTYRIDLLGSKDRKFIREALLLKQCRKRYKEFQFWLFSDLLLYGERLPLGTFALNRQLPLAKCMASELSDDDPDYHMSFVLRSPAKSFKVKTRCEGEKKEWICAISEAIENQRAELATNDTQVAPLWKPDSKSRECELCHASFTLLFRRHHCRNCGALVCVNCSSHRFLLKHLHVSNPVRVCDLCHTQLHGAHPVPGEGEDAISNEANSHIDEDDSDAERDSLVSEGELDDFNDFLAKVELEKKESCPSKYEAENRKAGLQLPIFQLTVNQNADPSPTKESTISKFLKRNSTSRAPTSPSHATSLVFSSNPISQATSAKKTTDEAEEVFSLSQTPPAPPPKPPRRGSQLVPVDPNAPLPLLAAYESARTTLSSPNQSQSKRISRRTNVFLQVTPSEDNAESTGNDDGRTKS